MAEKKQGRENAFAETYDEAVKKVIEKTFLKQGISYLIKVDKVREIMKIAQEPVSLETPIGEEEDSHLGDFIPDDDAPEPAEAVIFPEIPQPGQ